MEDSVIITSENIITADYKDWFDDAVENARRQIMEQEDTEIFKILDAIAAAEQ